MAMLTLNGTVQNFFVQPARKDKEGNERPESMHVQILAENVLESGEKRLEMVTLKVLTDLLQATDRQEGCRACWCFCGQRVYHVLRAS